MENDILVNMRKEYCLNLNGFKEYLTVNQVLLKLDVEKEDSKYKVLSEKKENLKEEVIKSIYSQEALTNVIQKYMNIIKNTNGIYVYMGTYRLSAYKDKTKCKFISVAYDDNKAEFSLYRNVENGKCFAISTAYRNNFEDENIVIQNTKDSKSMIDMYHKMQKIFFVKCMLESQEKAIQEMLKYLK